MTTRTLAADAAKPAAAYPHVASLLFGPPLLLPAEHALSLADALSPRLDRGERPALPVVPRATGADRVALTIVEGETVRVGGGLGAYGLTPDGVAIVPVIGELTPRYSWLKAASGLTAYDTVRLCVTEAAKDQRVRAILLDIDSPGGSVIDCGTTAALIAKLRGVKPVWASGNGMMTSAAYWLGAAAERVSLVQFGAAGSLGAVIIHRDLSAADEKDGIRYTPIAAGARKVEGWGHAPLDDQTRERLQAAVERARATFVADVAAMRSGAGLTEEAALATEAATLSDDDALGAHLVDAVESFEDTLGALVDQLRATASRPATSPTASAKQGAPMLKPNLQTAAALSGAVEEEEMPVDGAEDGDDAENAEEIEIGDGQLQSPKAQRLTAAAPAMTAIAAARAAGVAEGTIAALLQAGAAQERARLSALDEVALPGMEALAATAREKGWTAEQFAVQQAQAQKRLGAGHLAALAADAKALPSVPATPRQPAERRSPDAKPAADQPLETRAKAEWDKNPSLRTEFGDFDSYLAFARAEADGRLYRQSTLS